MRPSVLWAGVGLLALAAGCESPNTPPPQYYGGAPIATRSVALAEPPPLPPASVRSIPPPQIESSDYRLRPGSLIEVVVAQSKALSSTVRLGTDGQIYLPFVGRLSAAGRTPASFARELEKVLAERGYVRDPQVDVAIVESSEKVYLLGRVNKPGVYNLPVGRRLRFSQAIAVAGGLYAGDGPRPDPSAIRLIREVDGERRTYRLSFVEITVNGRLELDVELQPGDVIWVPEQQNLFVFGSVQRPGGFPLQEGNRLGVEEVLALAGGFNNNASRERVLLVRRERGGVRTYRLPSDPVRRARVELTAGDTIVVPSRGLRRVFVLGAVGEQGGIPLDEDDLTVTKALALAGGLNRIAAGNSVQLIRRGADGKKRVYPVPVAQIIEDGQIEKDPILEPGDIIWVPESFL